MIMRSAALFYIVFSITCAPLSMASDMEMGAAGKIFQLVTKEGKVVAKFSISEGDNFLITLENGVPQVRDIGSDAVAASQIMHRDSGQQGSYIERAKTLLQKKEYGAVISLLSDKAYQHPNDFELNLLLARAEVEKCEQQKVSGDNSYKASVMSVYQRGQRLYNMNRNHPEPYYIIAKSLYLNDRAPKACDIARKAVYFAPFDPHYQLFYGDLLMERAATWQDDLDSADYVAKTYKEAMTAYEKALYNTKLDEGLQKKIRAKIERIHKLTTSRRIR